MATLWIREYTRIAGPGVWRGEPPTVYGEGSPMAQEPGSADPSPVTISGTSAQSAAFNDDTKFIELWADAAFHYLVGADPEATTNHMPVEARTSKFIGVTAGQKVAARTMA
ncbi:MAG: hypothetical protein AB7F22_10590 [Reyranella sp.]|uniref:hypothetical protein n=1 Tax=Reyranella sp. TaxID=1929291 RepID=UPI003D0A3C7B